MSTTGNCVAFHAALRFAEHQSRAERFEQKNRGRGSRAEVPVENAIELEEGECVLRLLLFQATLQKRRNLDFKG